MPKNQVDRGTMNLLDSEGIKWKRFTGNGRFDYPIDYSAALLDVREDGHIDLLYKWAPNCYCHFHRHMAETTSTVLAGELHVIDVDLETGEETGRRVRKAGDFAHKAPGDVHMEMGGAQGALVLFSLYAPDGNLSDTLAADGTVISTSMLAPVLERRAQRSAR